MDVIEVYITSALNNGLKTTSTIIIHKGSYNMPSFDLVSKVEMNELKNAVEMVRKVVAARYDFKGSVAAIEIQEKDNKLELKGEDDYKMQTLLDLLRDQMVKRKIGLSNLQPEKVVPSGKNLLKQTLIIKNGIDKELGKTINKIVKNSGMKVHSSLMDEKIRLEGKNIDDLQAVFHLLKTHPEVNLDLQMENMKR
jgi:uncharacterized protein YajQ (UPF0234 family)